MTFVQLEKKGGGGGGGGVGGAGVGLESVDLFSLILFSLCSFPLPLVEQFFHQSSCNFIPLFCTVNTKLSTEQCSVLYVT